MDRWEQDAQRLKSWAKDVRYRAGIVRTFCGTRALDEIAEVAGLIKSAGHENGLAPASINRYLAILRRVGYLAERWGWTDRSLGRAVQLLPGERPRDVLLTPAQIESLAAACRQPEGDAIRLLAMTGLRRAELLRLTPASIDGDVILLDSTTKSGRPRAIPMPPAAARIAQTRLPWALTAKTLRREFEAARAAVGLPDVRLHDLRHAYASRLVQSGANLGAVRDLLGHSSLAVTSKYSHLAPEHLRDAVAGAFGAARVSGGNGRRGRDSRKRAKAA